MLIRSTFEMYSLRLSIFFASKALNKRICASYYLLGQRGDYLIFRASALADTMHRLYVFLRAGTKPLLQKWLLSCGIQTLNLNLWFARITAIGMYAQLGKSYALIYWNGYFFSLRTFYFSINTARFLGAEIIFILTSPNRIGKYQINALRSFGIPTVGVEYNIELLGYFNFSLPQNTTKSRGALFYSRLLACMLKVD